MTSEATVKPLVSSDLQLKFFRACERMRSNEVPESDRGSTLEPITVDGWYEISTKSGRPAWALFVWTSAGGRHHPSERHCTYNREHFDRANELVAQGANPFAKDE